MEFSKDKPVNYEDEVKIISFTPHLAKHFEALNKAWLEQYFEVEPIDAEMLSNPQRYFIDKDGYIYFATINNEIAGTFALLKVNDKVYELSKMAVDANFQGKKIGNTMMQFCINKARELQLNRIILYSNTKLQPAIHLYKKYGFVEIKNDTAIYKRSDIKMELTL